MTSLDPSGTHMVLAATTGHEGHRGEDYDRVDLYWARRESDLGKNEFVVLLSDQEKADLDFLLQGSPEEVYNKDVKLNGVGSWKEAFKGKDVVFHKITLT